MVKDAITGIRTIRAESGVAPSKRVDAFVISPDAEARGIIEAHRSEFMNLARLAELTIQDAEAARPDHAGVKVLEGMEVAVPLKGLVDFGAEAERIQKAIAKSVKERDKINRKLSNPNFVDRAPAAVVQKDRERASELDAMLAKMDESLQRVQELAGN